MVAVQAYVVSYGVVTGFIEVDSTSTVQACDVVGYDVVAGFIEIDSTSVVRGVYILYLAVI